MSLSILSVVWTDPVKGTSDEISEDTGTNTVIKNLTAETAVTYTIRSQNPDTDTFDIINTNELVLVKSLDFETVTDYSLSLR